jgi:hypothetical protein
MNKNHQVGLEEELVIVSGHLSSLIVRTVENQKAIT